MNRLAQARDTLVQAISPVLPGRTAAYPPTPQQSGLAPAVWIDQPDGFRTTIGERTQVMVATFPVNVVYDGTDRAQVAGLDDIVSGIVDAVAAIPCAEVARWRRLSVDPNQPNRRGSVLEVDYTVTATTLCLPTPVEAVIPPQPVEV